MNPTTNSNPSDDGIDGAPAYLLVLLVGLVILVAMAVDPISRVAF